MSSRTLRFWFLVAVNILPPFAAASSALWNPVCPAVSAIIGTDGVGYDALPVRLMMTLLANSSRSASDRFVNCNEVRYLAITILFHLDEPPGMTGRPRQRVVLGRRQGKSHANDAQAFTNTD
jgi:hypothetical protein